MTILILIIQVQLPGSNKYSILIICLTKFYSNSVLLCLNLRASNVNGVGRHTILSGFQTDNNVSTSRIPFDVKVERNVEKCSSSGVLSGGFHSDLVGNSSDYGVDECRTAREYRPGVDYPISIHTLPNIGFRTNEKSLSSLAHSPLSDDAYKGHPFRTSESVRTESPACIRNASSMASAQALPDHPWQDGQHSTRQDDRSTGQMAHCAPHIVVDQPLSKLTGSSIS